jgi:hypothetical protein
VAHSTNYFARLQGRQPQPINLVINYHATNSLPREFPFFAFSLDKFPNGTYNVASAAEKIGEISFRTLR